MAGTKRDRQKALRQARREREAALARARARRQRLIRFGLGAAVIVLVAVFLSSRAGDDTTEETTAPTTTVAEGEVASAAGKPCVAVSDPLPSGAPQVPVKVGPPPTQLVTEDLAEGSGAIVAATDTVTVNYIGVTCSTGKVFDSSYSRNQPATFALNGVIKGWTDGVPGMKVGGRRLLGIPSEQAYGAEGRPPTIAPDEPLWFVVEMVETKPA